MAADPKAAVNGGNFKFNPAQPWRVEDSLDLYNVNAWGKGYFSINEAGHVIVRPDTQSANTIDLFEVVEGLKERDLTAPVVVRFNTYAKNLSDDTRAYMATVLEDPPMQEWMSAGEKEPWKIEYSDVG